jgi:hypothetical protein
MYSSGSTGGHEYLPNTRNAHAKDRADAGGVQIFGCHALALFARQTGEHACAQRPNIGRLTCSEGTAALLA